MMNFRFEFLLVLSFMVFLKEVKEERRIAGYKRILSNKFGAAIIGILFVIIILINLFKDNEKIKKFN